MTANAKREFRTKPLLSISVRCSERRHHQNDFRSASPRKDSDACNQPNSQSVRLLIDQAAVVECVTELPALIEAACADDLIAVATQQKRIALLENDADNLKHALRLHLPRSLFCPSISAIGLRVVRTIIVSWLVTLPTGAILAIAFFMMLKFNFS